MGKLRSNRAVGDLQGTVGGLVYVHRADGTVIVRRLAESHAPFTEPQKGSQRRFAQAQHYTKVLKADPEQYAPYKVAARIRRERACDLAAGIQDLWTWGFEACGHMSALAGSDPAAVWEVLRDALTGR